MDYLGNSFVQGKTLIFPVIEGTLATVQYADTVKAITDVVINIIPAIVATQMGPTAGMAAFLATEVGRGAIDLYNYLTQPVKSDKIKKMPHSPPNANLIRMAQFILDTVQKMTNLTEAKAKGQIAGTISGELITTFRNAPKRGKTETAEELAKTAIAAAGHGVIINLLKDGAPFVTKTFTALEFVQAAKEILKTGSTYNQIRRETQAAIAAIQVMEQEKKEAIQKLKTQFIDTDPEATLKLRGEIRHTKKIYNKAIKELIKDYKEESTTRKTSAGKKRRR